MSTSSSDFDNSVEKVEPGELGENYEDFINTHSIMKAHPDAQGRTEESLIRSQELSSSKTWSQRKPVALPAPPPVPQFSSYAFFLEEMKKSVGETIGECIEFLQKDPRGYQPFYLRIFKYIMAGKAQGLIESNEDVLSIWNNFDMFALSEWKLFESGTYLGYTGPQSPYVRCAMAAKGQQVFVEPKGLPRGKARAKVFSDVSTRGKAIFRLWKQNQPIAMPSASILHKLRSNLKVRLDFFDCAKHLTFPGYIHQLNQLWQEFLEGYQLEVVGQIVAIRSKRYSQIPVRFRDEQMGTNGGEKLTRRVSPQKTLKKEDNSPIFEEVLGHKKKSPCEIGLHKKKASQQRHSKRERTTGPGKVKAKSLKKDVTITEEERERKKVETYLKAQAYKASFTREEWEEKMSKQRARNRKAYANKTPGEKQKAYQKFREYVNNLPEDKLKKFKENSARSCKRYMQRLKKENPEKYKQLTVGAVQKKWGRFLEYQRTRTAQEAPEMREKRLLRYRVTQAKRRERHRLEQLGTLSPDEIEQRLVQVEAEVRNKPIKTTSYKPRLHARKPHKSANPQEERSNTSKSGFPSLSTESQLTTMPLAEPQSQITLEAPPEKDLIPSTYSTSYQLKEEKLVPTEMYFEIRLPPTTPPVNTCEVVPVKLSSSSYNSSTVLTTFEYHVEPLQLEFVFHKEEDSVLNQGLEELASSNLGFPQETLLVVNDIPNSPCPEMISSTTLSEQVAPPPHQSTVIREICDLCGETFKDRRRLIAHRHEAHHLIDSQGLQCPNCSHLATTPRALWHHYVTLHEDISGEIGLPSIHQKIPKRDARYQDTPNICEQCGKQFRQRCTLDDHIRRTHQGKGFYCSVCNTDCQSVVKLWRHKVERHRMRDLAPPAGVDLVLCRYCGQMIMRGYEAHVRKKHPESLAEFQNSQHNLKLPRCKEGSPSASSTVSDCMPYPRCKPTGPYTRPKKVPSQIFEKCEHCSKSIRRDLLSRHIREKHTKNVACPDCGKEFGEAYKVHEHYREVHAFDDIEKVLCSHKFISLANPRNAKTARCLICNHVDLPEKFAIRTHFLTFHNDIFEQLKNEMKPTYSCEFCPELVYTKEVELRSHFQSAHPTKSLHCLFCGRFKRTQAEMRKHMAIHQQHKKTRKSSCFICNMDFKIPKCKTSEQTTDDTMMSLSLHVQNTHPAQFFSCPKPNCSTFMYSKEALDQHQNADRHRVGESFEDYLERVFGGMKIKCDHCDKFFAMRTSWTIHMTKQHGWDERKKHQCQRCSQEFKRMEYFVGHVHFVHNIPLAEIVTLWNADKSCRTRKILRKTGPQLKKAKTRMKRTKQKKKSTSKTSSVTSSEKEDWICDINNYFRLQRKLIEKHPVKTSSKLSSASPDKPETSQVVKSQQEGQSFNNFGRKTEPLELSIEEDKRLMLQLVRLTSEEIVSHTQKKSHEEVKNL